MANKRKRRVRRKPVFQSEKYSIRALHEDREYGLYWYAWLWKLLRPLLIFLCSVLILWHILPYSSVYFLGSLLSNLCFISVTFLSNSCRYIFARIGESMPPCGVPL